MRKLVALLLLLTACKPIITYTPIPSEETMFLSKINNLRESLGVSPLVPNSALAITSCAWNDQLIAERRVYHDPNLRTAMTMADPQWEKGGENVGMGRSVDLLFNAFVASPTHYRNLVDPEFSKVGICVAHAESGKLFTTHRFMEV